MTAQSASTPALSCRDVTVRFGDFTALSGVSLDVAAGSTISLIGPNGAGKTTLINALSGRVALAGGTIALAGRDITRLPAHARARAGLGRSFQIINIFAEMTVEQNLRLGAQAHRFRLQPFWRPVEAWGDLTLRARETAAVVGLADVLDQPVGQLSHGRQRALELGLTLMTEPDVLLLDEPLAGVGRQEIAQTVALIDRVRRGRTVLLIEHNMDVVMALSDEIVVMMAGQVLMRGDPATVRNDPTVRRAYLGDDEAA